MLPRRAPLQVPPPADDTALGDLRFRALLSRDDWNKLPEAVRKRFSKRLSGGGTALYVGKVTAVRMSRAGRVLGKLLRPAGAPLPLFADVGVASVVSVTEDARTGGQVWTRMYANRQGFPQVIQSAKRFLGTTGLEEYVGGGVSMALEVRASEEGIAFHSAGYSVSLASVRIPIPRWLSPGDLVVTHRALDNDSFEFSMTLTHPLLGELIHQAAIYRDQAS
ncbi:MAG: DUF4166 domain-containing protein [Aestuariivirga sp.]